MDDSSSIEGVSRGKGKAAGSLHEVKPVDLVVGLLDVQDLLRAGIM